MVEQESLDVSVWGSTDGTDWGVRPLITFPQKFYTGTYALALDLAARPDILYLQVKWKVFRWGVGSAKPMFRFYVFAEPMAAAGPLLSLDLVFETGIKKIQDQGRLIDALDLKMSVLIGFLGALIIGLLAGLLNSDPAKTKQILRWWSKLGLAVGAALVTASLYTAFQAFRPRRYSAGLKFSDLLPYTNEDTKNTKEVFLPTLDYGIKENEATIAIKQRHVKRAVWCVFLALLVFLASLGEVAARLL